jgi:DNA-binding XRE family transcriptional regulator
MQYDLLHIQGKPFVLVPLHDYRSLSDDNLQSSTLPENIKDALIARTDHPVKILRKFHGLTQEELASSAGISRSYLTEIETGAKEGSLKTMKAIAAALGVDLGLLV